MAQSDANEKAKEILRMLIKQRFWIAIGFACLFAVIAYFMGSGPVKAKAADEIKAIETAYTNVKGYQAPTKPTEQYKPIVVEKTEIMTKDVNQAWKELYDRQAPLLTWPDAVKERIPKWGRKWPEEQGAGQVSLAIVDYIYAYPAYIDMVYKTFDPFNYETGEGIVAAPPKEELLRPFEFNIEKLPTLGKIWWAQERLWVQRTLLEVVHQVNKNANAKGWDSAIVKEIVGLEVGNALAQDQVSQAKGDELTPAEDIRSPEQEAAATAEASPEGGAGGAGGPMGEMMKRMMGPGTGPGGGPGGGLAKAAEEGVSFINKDQYKIVPVMMTVLIDEDHIQDLLVALENSPMSIQVKDIEIEKPSTKVEKPEKGEQRLGMGMMGGGMGDMMMRGMMGGRGGFGGKASMMRNEMMMMGRMGSMGMRQGMAGRMRDMGPMGGMGPAGGREERKKVDLRSQDLRKARAEKEQEIEKREGVSLFDPYFNIIQVKVYGQARFYNPPPAAEEAQPSSPGEVATSPTPGGEPDAKAEPGAGDAAKKAEAPPAPEAAKKAESDATKKAEPPAPEVEKKAEPVAPDAAKKAEPPPAGAPGEAAKAGDAGAAPKR